MWKNRIARTAIVLALCSVGHSHSVAAAPLPAGGSPHSVDQVWWRAAESGGAISHMKGAASADAILSVHVHATDSVVVGRVTTPNAVTVRVTRAGVEQFSSTISPWSDGSGYVFAAQLPQYPCFPANTPCGFNTGDRVDVTQSGATRSVVVPPLAVQADAASNVVSGTAAPAQAIDLYALLAASPGLVYTRSTTSSIGGAFSANFTGLADLRPNDEGLAIARPTVDTSFTRRFTLPFLRAYQRIRSGEPSITGRIAAWSNGSLYVDGRTDPLVVFGDSRGRFFTAYDNALDSSKHVTLTFGGQSMHLTKAPLSIKIDTTRRVTGKTSAGQRVGIAEFDSLYGDRGLFGVFSTALATETLLADANGLFTSTLVISPTRYALATVIDGEDDETAAIAAFPALQVRIGASPLSQIHAGYPVFGLANAAADTPITVTVRGPSGLTKTIWFLKSDANGNAVVNANSDAILRIEAGDVIDVRVSEQHITTTIPTMTAHRERVLNRIDGTAVPYARLRLEVIHSNSPFGATWSVTQTQAGADGVYSVDLTPITSPENYIQSTVHMGTNDGHNVIRHVDTIDNGASCTLSIDDVVVYGADITASSTCRIDQADLQLLSPGGEQKAAVRFSLPPRTPQTVGLRNATWEPVLILPGDRIVLAGPNTISATVQAISVTLTASGTVRGEAPPGSTLSVRLTRPLLQAQGDNSSHTYTGTASTSGAFEISTAGVPAGTLATISASASNQPTWTARAARRQLVVILSPNWWFPFTQILALLQPHENFTTTMTGNRAIFNGFTTSDALGVVNGSFITAPTTGQSIVLTTSAEVLSLTLPVLTAEYEPGNAIVRGNAPARAQVAVRYIQQPFWVMSELTTTVDAAGRFEIRLPSSTGSQYAIAHVAYIAPSGHEVRVFVTTAPTYSVVLNDPCVVAQPASFDNPFGVTVTVSSPTGVVKAHGTTSNGAVCGVVPVESGDRVTIQPSNERTASYVIPELSATYDYMQKTLRGRTTPSANIALVFWDQYSQELGTRNAVAGQDGAYAMDVSDLTVEATLLRTTVRIGDANGNRIERRISLARGRYWLPFVPRTTPNGPATPPPAVPPPIRPLPTSTPSFVVTTAP